MTAARQSVGFYELANVDKLSVRKAVFLDRDGVINRKAPEGQYITSWEQMEFLPGVDEAMRALKQAGFLLIIVTNQSAVSRNELALDTLDSIHRRMVQHLSQAGAVVDGIYYCPHDRSGKCGCRKPQPKMLQQAACEHGIDLLQSWMVGDTATDIEAGIAAGCRTVWLRPADFDGGAPPPADFSTDSIRDAAHWIMNADPVLD